MAKAKLKRKGGGDGYKRDSHGRFSSTDSRGGSKGDKKRKARLKRIAMAAGLAAVAVGAGALAVSAYRKAKSGKMNAAIDAAEREIGLGSPEAKAAFLKSFKNATRATTTDAAAEAAIPDAFKSATRAAHDKLAGIPAARRTPGQATDLKKLASKVSSLGATAAKATKAPGAKIDFGAMQARASKAGDATAKLIKAKAKKASAGASTFRDTAAQLAKSAARSAGAPIGRAVGAGIVGAAAGAVADRATRSKKRARARRKKAA